MIERPLSQVASAVDGALRGQDERVEVEPLERAPPPQPVGLPEQAGPSGGVRCRRRGGEEIEALLEHGIGFEVVPGFTVARAASRPSMVTLAYLSISAEGSPRQTVLAMGQW